MMPRMIAGEMARRYAGRISLVAFNPTFIIDKSDPELEKMWAPGYLGLFWKPFSLLVAKPPEVAGEPIVNRMISTKDRSAINSVLFKLDKPVEKPDKAMNDEVAGKRLWHELVLFTGLEPTEEKEPTSKSYKRTEDRAEDPKDNRITDSSTA